LKYAVWRQVVVHGLDPHAGYLHVDRSGRPRVGPHGGVQAARRPPSSQAQARRRLGGWRLTREARAQIVQRWAELKLDPAVA
jgi:CRISPR-associated protein Cas1